MTIEEANYFFWVFLSRMLDKIMIILTRILKEAPVQILMFHHITNEHVNTIESCKCRIDRFEMIINQFKEKGYHFISIDELLKTINKKSNIRAVVITFDDATEDVFLNAYPILKQLRIPFTVYIITDYINKAGFISDTQLNILNREPLCTLGSHTITHQMLRYSKNAFHEIYMSKMILENKLGKPVYHFAYPYGKISAVNIKNIKMAKRAGYKSAVSSINLGLYPLIPKKLIWYLPRIVV